MSETSAGPHDRTRSTDSSEVSANSTTAPDSSGLASLSINTADGNETASQNSRPTCVKCNKAASLWCAGSCSYSEERGAAELTRYCSKDCQQEDWPEHKNSCLEVGRVNQVYRVSRAVQALYYAFRENTFERNIDRIAIEQHRIRIWEKTREKVIVPFPSDLILDARDREAVLSCLSCDSAVVWMQRIFSKLLEGTYRKIEEFQLYPKNSLRQTTIVGNERPNPPRISPNGNPETQYRHRVFKLTTRGGAEYALDISGAQYGYHDPVIPWTDFMSHRVEYVVKISEFGYGRGQNEVIFTPRKLVISFGEPFDNAVTVNSRVVAQNMESELDGWLASKGTLPAALRKVSKAKSDTLMQEMIAKLSSSVKEFVRSASQTKKLIVAVHVIDRAAKRATFVWGNESTSPTAFPPIL